MQTIKLNSTGEDVKTLQIALGLNADGKFGLITEKKVREFQKEHGLFSDGVVGPKTWDMLLGKPKTVDSKEDIYVTCANKIGCEVEALKAVKQVETGGKKAFIAEGKPSILFEGHIFWKELIARGIDPNKYVKGNEDILYKSWTKKYYKGGLAEYTRLERARKINVDAANASASWGMFQVMGNNYKACKCISVSEFVSLMCKSEEDQLKLTTNFILSNATLKNALKAKNWETFARFYNGPAYKQNNYHIKLQQAYNKIKMGG